MLPILQPGETPPENKEVLRLCYNTFLPKVYSVHITKYRNGEIVYDRVEYASKTKFPSMRFLRWYNQVPPYLKAVYRFGASAPLTKKGKGLMKAALQEAKRLGIPDARSLLRAGGFNRSSDDPAAKLYFYLLDKYVL